MEKKRPIFNQNFSAFIERKGFDRNINFIKETKKGIVISIEMSENEKEEWMPKILFEDSDISKWRYKKLGKVI